jgi:hypothetical protein
LDKKPGPKKTRMASSILSPTSQVLPNTAAVIGLVPIALGVNAILRPRSGLSILEFAAPKEPETQKLVDNLIRIYGARDVAIGVPILLSWHFGDRRLLGWLLITGAFTACVDAWATKLQNGKGEWNHLPFSVIGVGLGGGILGWFGGN